MVQRDIDSLYDVFIKRHRHGNYGAEAWMVCIVYLLRHRNEYYGTERHGWSVSCIDIDMDTMVLRGMDGLYYVFERHRNGYYGTGKLG